MIPSDKRRPVDATVDTITGAIGMLWDWLGGEAPKADIVRVEKPQTRIRPEVIDTEGEDA